MQENIYALLYLVHVGKIITQFNLLITVFASLNLFRVPEVEQNCHFTFVIFFFSLLCALKCFWIWSECTYPKQTNNHHLITTKCSAIVQCVYLQYLNSIISCPIYETITESWWSSCSFNAAVSQKALEKISYCIFDSIPEQRVVTWFGGSCSIMHGCL